MESIGRFKGQVESDPPTLEKRSGWTADLFSISVVTYTKDFPLEASTMFHLLKDRLSSSTVFERTAFTRQIRREKARTDRSGTPFSLLSISAAFDTPPGRRLFSDLTEFSRDRLRLTDDIGWLNRRTIGILLPLTPAAGARVVGREYLERFGSRIRLETYSYPDAWFFEGMGESSLDGLEEADEDVSLGPDSPSLVSHALTPLVEQKLPLWKRSIDVLASGLGLLCLMPVLFLLSVLIKISSPGPVLFSQLRAGRGGKPFRIYKFRSMVVDAERLKRSLASLNEQDGPAFKIKNDPRITSIGHFMRRTSLDELPQLWNVFIGDMTLVGPRPLPCDESDACLPWQRARLQVTPGLTCIWQVYGRSKVTFDEWMRMDLEYIRNCSLALDLKLIWMTVWTSLVKKNGM